MLPYLSSISNKMKVGCQNLQPVFNLVCLFKITLDRLIQLFMECLGNLVLGFGCNLLGASVNHAFCHSVHEGAPVYEKVAESLAAVLFILPVCLCTLVIFKCIWSGTALCRKYSLYPIKTVCAVLALKVLQNLK